MIDKRTEASRRGMLNRAGKRPGYEHVTIAPQWHKSDVFLADMGPRPVGKTLDRIDNAKGYEPGNCRWATPQEQRKNRRPVVAGHPYYWTTEAKTWFGRLRARGITGSDLAFVLGCSASAARALLRGA